MVRFRRRRAKFDAHTNHAFANTVLTRSSRSVRCNIETENRITVRTILVDDRNGAVFIELVHRFVERKVAFERLLFRSSKVTLDRLSIVEFAINVETYLAHITVLKV